MPIKKKLMHFNSKVDFDKKSKATSISDNTSDIPYTSIVFIKDTKEIWTHGQLYPCQLTDTEISELLNSKVDKETGKSLVSDELITKLTGLKTLTEITADINNVKTTQATAIADAKKAGTDAQATANAAQATANSKVSKSGDSMTGPLIVQEGVRLISSNNLGYVQLGTAASKKGVITSMNGEPLTSLEISCANNALTTNNNKIWHAGNDGAESGLDADLLDGKHASEIAEGASATTLIPSGTARWIRVAEFTQYYSYGLFHVTNSFYNNAPSGITFDVQNGYFSTPSLIRITQLNGTSNLITKARIVSPLNETGTSYLELFYNSTLHNPIYVNVTGSRGCHLLSSFIDGSIPADYVTKEFTFTTGNTGSDIRPVYFVDGLPTACTYTLGKSVPSNAVFTDTTYSPATTMSNGLMSTSDLTFSGLKTFRDGIGGYINSWRKLSAQSYTSYKVYSSADESYAKLFVYLISPSDAGDGSYEITVNAVGNVANIDYSKSDANTNIHYIDVTCSNGVITGIYLTTGSWEGNMLVSGIGTGIQEPVQAEVPSGADRRDLTNIEYGNYFDSRIYGPGTITADLENSLSLLHGPYSFTASIDNYYTVYWNRSTAVDPKEYFAVLKVLLIPPSSASSYSPVECIYYINNGKISWVGEGDSLIDLNVEWESSYTDSYLKNIYVKTKSSDYDGGTIIVSGIGLNLIEPVIAFSTTGYQVTSATGNISVGSLNATVVAADTIVLPNPTQITAPTSANGSKTISGGYSEYYMIDDGPGGANFRLTVSTTTFPVGVTEKTIYIYNDSASPNIYKATISGTSIETYGDTQVEIDGTSTLQLKIKKIGNHIFIYWIPGNPYNITGLYP